MIPSLSAYFSILLLFAARNPSKIPRSALPYTVFLHAVSLLTILAFSECGRSLSARVSLEDIRKACHGSYRGVRTGHSVYFYCLNFLTVSCRMVIKNLVLGVKRLGKYTFTSFPIIYITLSRLRLFSIIPLVLSLITARRLLHSPPSNPYRVINTHISRIFILNPFILALSPTVLLLMLISSLAFATLIFWLLLFGYATNLEGTTGVIYMPGLIARL